MASDPQQVMEISLPQPDDFHHHLRDGDVLPSVMAHASRQFDRIIVMPNTKPPILTLADAQAYKARIAAASPPGCSSRLLMTLYLTDKTTPETIREAKASGVVFACKLYPQGATTNSDSGVSSITSLYPLLQVMSDCRLPLLVHGEVTDPSTDIFDRERLFIESVLAPIVATFPDLKVVMEHITTAEAASFVTAAGPNVAATITAHHLLYNRTDLFKGGVCPHLYCLPILKRERHRVALLAAATSGSHKFFLGTDSAPHAVDAKQSACGCAGCFTGHAAIELYAEAFDSVGRLDQLAAFASSHGAAFYELDTAPIPASGAGAGAGAGVSSTGAASKRVITLERCDWTVPDSYPFGSQTVRPLRAGETVRWRIKDT